MKYVDPTVKPQVSHSFYMQGFRGRPLASVQWGKSRRYPRRICHACVRKGGLNQARSLLAEYIC